MKNLALSQMDSFIGGQSNVAGWICAVGAGVAGGSWAYFIGLAEPIAGAICGLVWNLVSGWACSKVDAAYNENPGGGGR